MRLTGIDIFAGAGGLSQGAGQAGIPCAIALESDPHAARTYAFNHPDTQVIQGDIRDFDFRTDLPKPEHNQRIVLFGGPPCQGFSISNQKTRIRENGSNWLFEEFLRGVRDLQPAWVVFENVRGIAVTDQAGFLDRIITGLEKLGYQVRHTILNAARYGVPQTRSRLFLVASRNLTGFEFPKPIRAKPVCVHDAISDLPILKPGAADSPLPYGTEAGSDYARKMREISPMSCNNSVTRNARHVIARYRYIPQGGNWSSIPEILMRDYSDVSRCHTNIYLRLRANAPSTTISNYRKAMLIHPEQDRGLSVREAARLQSFPDHYRFFGSIGFQQQQVANAVPPMLAQAVFKQIIRAERKTGATATSGKRGVVAADAGDVQTVHQGGAENRCRLT